MKIRAARSDDLDVIKALLAENELPVDDVDAALLVDFLVAEDVSGRIVGSVGLERVGTDALLRSLAVVQTSRNAGLGVSPAGSRGKPGERVRHIGVVVAYNDG